MVAPSDRVLFAVLIVLPIVAAVLPVPTDPLPPPEEYGTGASSVEPSYSGLQRRNYTDNGVLVEGATCGNQTAGIAVYNLRIGFEESEIDVEPNPEHNWIHDNVLENNGYDPDPAVRELGIPGADILWDVSGWNNRFDQPGASAFPPILPTSNWPAPLYRVYWRMLNFLIGLVS